MRSQPVINENQWSASCQSSNDMEWVQITENIRLCDSGANLSFVDESFMKAPNLTGQQVDLNVGTPGNSSKPLRVKIGD